MLTVEIRDAGIMDASKAEVEIYFDTEGLALLLQHLGQLRDGETHVHLMTPAWAGVELDEKKCGKGTELINHLRMTLMK